MIVIGIDPGASGSIVRLDAIDGPSWIKLAETEADVAEWLREHSVQKVHAFLERVHSMPKQGVASSFKFGASYGFLKGILVGLRIAFEEVTPQMWQKAMGCRTGGDKRITKSRAQELFPQIKVTHANADALLIAEYGRRQLALRSHAGMVQ